jgi:hypothetical protein
MRPAEEGSDHDLYLAIGRLVTESARFEQELHSTVLSFFVDDHLTLLFTGRSWEWYVESIKTVLAQLHHSTWQRERQALLEPVGKWSGPIVDLVL